MPWAAGTYTKGNNGTGGWTGDASLGIGIEAGRHDTQDNDFATGINQCLNKDGSNAATGDLNLGGFRPVNLAAGTAAAPAICAGNDVNTGIFGPAADTLAVATNGTERMRIDSNGNIGIGLTNPTSLLSLGSSAGSVVHTRFSTDTSGPVLSFQKSKTATIGNNVLPSSGDITGLIAFSGANGTNYDSTAFIISKIDGTPGASNDMPGRLEFHTTPDGTGNPIERMRIENGGTVCINVAGNFGVERLCIEGNSVQNGIGIRDKDNPSGFLFAAFRNSANTLIGSIQRATTTNAVNFNTTSDYRLKTNIEPLSNALQRTLQLNPVGFTWVDGNQFAEGFIAHELATVFPQAVSGNKDDVYEDNTPKYQSVDYSKLTPLLTKAIQELNAKVEALEARVAELEA